MVEYPEQPSLLETLMSGKIGRGAHAFDASERLVAPVLEALGAALRGRGSLVRAAYCPVVPIL